ncbi:hypothetical protein PUNSTDRAFT_141589 [Punctularia strigosozonata HHB-11173 SS5]|uniref:uncharacterized protein n=1 Tax=Punctularia strigosozonata (strain HHB-11173) TaxID=741275 RepID=UPI00044175CB|nr:uncharacterized protein PUNSTDRAFT_141589 [Punctularia strigosozonata HHB-11173 SS5]EIN13087.1 hypothetical protein PUNSTDRAFT_141589 [Punctularia strigosozonata HHB-11173 SS5]
MSLPKAALVLLQAIINQLATTPPHPVPPTASRTPTPLGSPQLASRSPLPANEKKASPEPARAPSPPRIETASASDGGGVLYGEDWRILRLAPLIFKLQQPVVWTLALCEIAAILYANLAVALPDVGSAEAAPNSPLSRVGTALCPSPATANGMADIRITTLYAIGFVLSTFGGALRLLCYRYLGHLFTFSLWKAQDHVLVQTGPYAVVRHPSYTGSMLLNSGLTLSFFMANSGSWAVACGVFGRGDGLLPASPPIMLFVAMYWGYYVLVGITRARAEDAELKRTFGAHWDAYASRTINWFFPGIW